VRDNPTVSRVAFVAAPFESVANCRLWRLCGCHLALNLPFCLRRDEIISGTRSESNVQPILVRRRWSYSIPEPRLHHSSRVKRLSTSPAFATSPSSIIHVSSLQTIDMRTVFLARPLIFYRSSNPFGTNQLFQSSCKRDQACAYISCTDGDNKNPGIS